MTPDVKTVTMIPYRILLQNSDGETTDIVAGHLDATLWELLRAFREEAGRLSACAWVAAGLPGSYRLRFDRDWTHVEEPDAPSEGATREVIHCLRPFVLQSERLYFPRVSGRLYKAADHPWLRAWTTEIRDTYMFKGATRSHTITRNVLDLTSDEAFDPWIDAFEYHRHGKDDSRKVKFLELHGGPPDAMTRAVLREALRYKVFAIEQLAGFVRRLEESPTHRRYLAEQSSPTARDEVARLTAVDLQSLPLGLGALGVTPEPRAWLDQPQVFSGGGLLGTVMDVALHDADALPARLRLLAHQAEIPAYRGRLEDAAAAMAAGGWLEGGG